ncbi:MAG: DUF3987 domain-containing protein [Paludibacter sp.]|nr:DUF3987 domain-containing protein [Paludibacter sp.]
MIDEKQTPSDLPESEGANEIMQNKNTDFINLLKSDIQSNSKQSEAKDNPFPIEVFSPVFRNIIMETRDTLNFPVDYSAATILAAVATAIGKTALLQVKNGWKEFCPLYMSLIGNAGASKSHPLDMLFDILKTIDKENYNNYEPLYTEFIEYQSLTKKEKKNIIAVEEPILTKTLMSNFTPEILAKRIADNKRSVCVISEELETWLLGMNNYSKADQSSTYLSMWSVKRTDIDRVGQHQKPMTIERPFLCIIGTSQPRKLKKMFPMDKSDSGFLQRFLWAYPAKSEKQIITENELNNAILEDYNRWIRAYIENNPGRVFPDGQPMSKVYTFTPEARAFFYKWQAENANKVNAAGDSLLSEELNKFDVHYLRFALILEIMEGNNTSMISIKAAENAAKLCKYFENTMYMVLEKLESSENNALDMKKVAKFLLEKGETQLKAARLTGLSQSTISRLK